MSEDGSKAHFAGRDAGRTGGCNVGKTRAFRCKMLTQMGYGFAGLSIFNPFSDENAFQMDTNTRFGSECLPANPHPI